MIRRGLIILSAVTAAFGIFVWLGVTKSWPMYTKILAGTFGLWAGVLAFNLYRWNQSRQPHVRRQHPSAQHLPVHGTNGRKSEGDDEFTAPNTLFAWGIVLCIWAVLAATGWTLVSVLLNILDVVETHRMPLTNKFGGLLGFGFVVASFPVTLKFNSLFEGFLAISLLTNRVTKHGRGLHPLPFWVRRQDRFTLRPTEMPFAFKVPSLKGPYHVHGESLITPRERQIGKFIKLGTTDEERFRKVASLIAEELEAKISARTGGLEPEAIQRGQVQIKHEVLHTYETDKNSLEDTCGCDIIGTNFSMDPDVSIQRAQERQFDTERDALAARNFEGINEQALNAYLAMKDKRPQSHTINEWRITGANEILETVREVVKENPDIAKSALNLGTGYLAGRTASTRGGGGDKNKEKNKEKTDKSDTTEKEK